MLGLPKWDFVSDAFGQVQRQEQLRKAESKVGQPDEVESERTALGLIVCALKGCYIP